MSGGKLEAGRLRERVTIEGDAKISNGKGGWLSNWATIAKVRAEIIGLSGTEALKLGVERNVQLWRVTIRKRDGVTAGNRLQWGNLTLNITATMPDPNDPKAALVLSCESGF